MRWGRCTGLSRTYHSGVKLRHSQSPGSRPEHQPALFSRLPSKKRTTSCFWSWRRRESLSEWISKKGWMRAKQNWSSTTFRPLKQSNIPHKETKLVPDPAILFLEFEIIDCPSAFRFWEVGEECFIIQLFRLLLRNNCGAVFTEVKNDVFVGFLQFQSLEIVETIWVNTDTGGLIKEMSG